MNRDYYDRVWERQLTGRGAPRPPSRLRRVLARWETTRHEAAAELVLAEADPPAAFLDVGCGAGHLLELVHAHFDEAAGVDFSRRALDAARSRLAAAPRVSLVEHALDEPLPFEDARFDVVACIAVLEHVFDVHRLVEELARVAKPGGRIVVEVPNIAYVKHRVALALGRLPSTSAHESIERGWDGGHLHYFTEKALRDLLASAGLVVQGVTGTGAFARYRAWRPSLLCGDVLAVAEKRR